MTRTPYRWLTNIIRLQEKRSYSFATILGFAVFVGTVRLMQEWVLGLRPIDDLPARLLINISFYLMCFFTYTAAMRLVVPQSWRRTINVVLIGIFCGILPPVIDLAVQGRGGFVYSYAWLPDWKWQIYDPDAHLTVGESSVLWATILLSGCYVWIKTRSPLRTALGLVLAYAVVLFNMAGLYTGAAHLFAAASLKKTVPYDMVNCQLAVTLVLYLALQGRVAAGLARRINHALPFALIFLGGAAFAGAMNIRIATYALLPLLAFAVAIAQNDFFDREDDAVQHRRSYLDAEDVAFLTLLLLGFAINFVQLRSALGAGLLIFFVVSVLYNYPHYRAKAYFPSNLKIEGVWGASACFMGVVAAVEAPVRTVGTHLAKIEQPVLARAFGWPTIAMLFLVFGGWSLVAALKDYKDLRADLRAGVQTVYTLAVRRHWGLRRAHVVLKAAVAVGLLLPGPLLWWAGRLPLGYSAGGVAASAAVWSLMSSAPSARRFEWALAVINGYLAYLTLLLALS